MAATPTPASLPGRERGNGRIRVMSVIARMNVGGPALEVVNTSQDLDPLRFDHRIVTGSVEPGEADYLELRAPGVDVHQIAGLGRSIRVTGDLRAFATVRSEIRRFRPHILHTHTAKAGALARLAAFRGSNCATVHTFHGHLLHGYFSPPMTRMVVRVERALARRTTRLIAVGVRVRDELLAAGIGTPEQFVVVPPGVDPRTPPMREDARRALALPGEAPVVAFVARLTRVKRPDRFLEVARQVIAAKPETIFVVAGEGDELGRTRARAAELGLDAHIRFVGWRPDVEVVYAAADAIVLTSDNEGMPVSLIEAAMVGCPAVTTDVGSAGEVVIHGATGLVTDLDAHAVAHGLNRLLNDTQLRSRLGRAAAEHARRQFNRRRLVGDLASLYESLTSERGVARMSS